MNFVYIAIAILDGIKSGDADYFLESKKWSEQNYYEVLWALLQSASRNIMHKNVNDLILKVWIEQFSPNIDPRPQTSQASIDLYENTLTALATYRSMKLDKSLPQSSITALEQIIYNGEKTWQR
ncbi:MAG TPA: hypothetical protein PKD79_02365 [Candidatus Doudnabacteria bacterium]|nr:hypothetical protein [Candidatus Doudnabacteria bacterium]